MQPSPVRLRIWDLPTRLCHWLMALFFVTAWLAAENHQLTLHRLAGYGVFVVVLFRLYWGIAGSATARFAAFVRGPAAFMTYAGAVLARPGPVTAGHNPMGGWSVVAMLGGLALVIGLGLFSSDAQSLDPGPFYSLIGFAAARRVGSLHEAAFNVLAALTVLHVAAILFYVFYKRENLLAAMITGFKDLPSDTPPPRVAAGWHAAVAALVSLLSVIAVANADTFL